MSRLELIATLDPKRSDSTAAVIEITMRGHSIGRLFVPREDADSICGIINAGEDLVEVARAVLNDEPIGSPKHLRLMDTVDLARAALAKYNEVPAWTEQN